MTFFRLTTIVLLTMLCVPSTPALSRTPPPRPMKAKALKGDIKKATECTVLHPARCAPLKTLVSYGDAAGPALLSTLKRKKDERARVALAALGSIRYKAAGEYILTLATHKDKRVRHLALSALGRLNPSGAVEALARAVGTEDLTERLIATAALGATKAPGAVVPLIRLLENFHPKVRVAAIRALAAVGDPRALSPIAVMIADPVTRTPVRIAAVEALGRLKLPGGVAILLQAAGDPDDAVRLKAIRSLGQVGDGRATGLLSLLVREPKLQLTSIVALGSIGDSAALPVLLRLIKAESTSREVLEKAFWALGSIKGDSTASALRGFLEATDTQLISWTCDALGRVGSETSIQPLIDTLNNKDEEVKKMAAWALQKITGVNLGTDLARWEKWYFARQEQR